MTRNCPWLSIEDFLIFSDKTPTLCTEMPRRETGLYNSPPRGNFKIKEDSMYIWFMKRLKNNPSKVGISFKADREKCHQRLYPIYEPEPLIMGSDPIEYNGKMLPKSHIDFITI